MHAHHRSRIVLAISVLMAASAASCGAGGGDTIRLYTSVTEATVTALVGQFEAETGLDVDVFRAPTGELAARIAAEEREGGIQADVLWLTDPLTMQEYATVGVLDAWEPEGADEIDPAYRSDRFWGTRILSMVIVQRDNAPLLASWRDLAAPDLAGRIAAPDPGFAGSALAVLGYFASDPDYGLDFYRELRDNGLVVVNAPGEVVTGVAEGRFDAGITLDFSARDARDKGSPIVIVWPEPGAIALYSPIGVVDGAGPAARRFTEFVLSLPGQQIIADGGWQPIRADVAWAVGGPQVAVDWAELAARSDELMAAYRAIFDE